MKNNIKIICIFIFSFNFYFNISSASEDFIFESKSIELLNSTQTILAKDGVKINSNDGIKISALLSKYDKKSKILVLEKDIVIKDNPNNLTLKSEKIT